MVDWIGLVGAPSQGASTVQRQSRASGGSEWPLPLLQCRLQLAPSGSAPGGPRSLTIQQEEAEVGLHVHNTTPMEKRLLMKSV